MGLAKQVAHRHRWNEVLWDRDIPPQVIKTKPTRRVKKLRVAFVSYGLPKNRLSFEKKLERAIAEGGRAATIPKRDRPRMKKLESLLID